MKWPRERQIRRHCYDEVPASIREHPDGKIADHLGMKQDAGADLNNRWLRCVGQK